MKTHQHWVEHVLRRPWVIGAKGPDEFDCYGLCYFVRKRFFGQEIPSYDAVSYDGVKELAEAFRSRFSGWVELDTPEEGCVVALSRSKMFIHHCGIWTWQDRGLVIHTTKFAKMAIAQSVLDLRRDGWKRIEFFRYVGQGQK